MVLPSLPAKSFLTKAHHIPALRKSLFRQYPTLLERGVSGGSNAFFFFLIQRSYLQCQTTLFPTLCRCPMFQAHICCMNHNVKNKQTNQKSLHTLSLFYWVSFSWTFYILSQGNLCLLILAKFTKG